MKKIFTLGCGLLLMSALAVNEAKAVYLPQSITIEIQDYNRNNIASSVTTELTKDEDGNYVIQDFLYSESPVKFTFGTPDDDDWAAITFTGNIDNKYPDTPYLLDEYGDDMECAVENLEGVDEANVYYGYTWIYNPCVYADGYSYVYYYEKSDDDYDYYASICLRGTLYDGSKSPYLYLNFWFNEPEQVEYPEAPEFPKTIDYTINGEKELPGVNVEFKEGEWGPTMTVTGESDAETIALTFAVPEGWDGWIINADWADVSERPIAKTRGEDGWYPLDFYLDNMGFQKGNSVTFAVEEDDNYATLALYKGDNVYETTIDIEYNVVPAGGVVEKDPVFPESIVATIFDEGLEVEHNNEDGEIFIAVTGEIKEETFDVVLDVPEGWTGFISMPVETDDVTISEYYPGPRMAKVQEAEWVPVEDVMDDGVFKGNKFTFTANGTRQQVEVHLYKDDMVDVNNFITLTANVKKYVDPELIAANQEAYDKVISQLNEAQAKYEAALKDLKEKYPYYDFSEWKELIGGALDQTRTGAKQALDAANEDGGEFFYPFDDEEIMAMIAEMENDAKNAPKFPESLDVTLSDNEGVKVSQGVEQGVYTISVSGQSEQKELTVTVAVPEGWDGFIGMSDVDESNGQAAPSKVAPAEWVSVEEMVAYGMKKGNTMTFPVNGIAHSGQYYLYKGDVLDLANQIAIEFDVQSPLTAANKAAYDAVIAKIDALQTEYEAALAAVKEKYPGYDFSEWEEIIGKALAEAASGAEQALKAANEDGTEFNFAFDGEDIKGMIAEMDASAALSTANQAAYDAVIAKVDALQKEYEAALAAVKEKYPDYDFSEWEEMISKALDEAKSGAEQALKAADNDGVEFNFAFDGEDIKGMIAEMEASPALTYANQEAYESVIAKIDELQKEYEEAVAEIKEKNPDFDLTEWEEIIGNALEDAKAGAKQALDSANEDGEEFNFVFDGEDIEGMIAEMKESAAGSGVAGVAVDDNASYYDLNGHKINRPQAGMYIKVVDGNSSKVVIK